MKRLMTLAIAVMIAGATFGQKKTANNPLVSEQNYKHPFAAKAAKENNTGVSEKFSTENVNEAQDYKHSHSRKNVKKVHVRRGSGVSPAASHKHPLG